MADRHNDANSITTRNQKHSPLLHLPAELRNIIYAYCFAETVIDASATRNYARRNTMRIYNSEKKPTRLVLWRVCKQTHTESRSLLFESATFRIGRERGYESFLSGVSAPELKAIRTLRFDCHMAHVFARGDLMRNCYAYLDPPVPRGLCLFTLLAGFGGVKRIVVESEGRQELSTEAKYDFAAAVKHCLGDRGEVAEIVYGADDWLCEIGAPTYTTPAQDIGFSGCVCWGHSR